LKAQLADLIAALKCKELNLFKFLEKSNLCGICGKFNSSA